MKRLAYWVVNTPPFFVMRGTCLLQGCLLPTPTSPEEQEAIRNDLRKLDQILSWDTQELMVIQQDTISIQRLAVRPVTVRGMRDFHYAQPPPNAKAPFLITDDFGLTPVYCGEIEFERDMEGIPNVGPIPGHQFGERAIWAVEGKGWIGAVEARRVGWLRPRKKWYLTAFATAAQYTLCCKVGYCPAEPVGTVTRVLAAPRLPALKGSQ